MSARRCGDCTLCCRLLPVRELEKPAGQRCRHQSRNGCGIYHRPGFPTACAVWSCRWLVDDDRVGLRRPDRSGYVIDMMPDLVRARHKETGETVERPVLQVWCDPARPEAWRDPALLRYAKRRAREKGEAMIVRFSTTKAIVVVAPPLSETGDWRVIDPEIVASPSGNLLTDKLREWSPA